MKIKLEGVVSNELVGAATEGRIYPYAVCGVDVYRRPEIALEDGVEIDRSRKLPFTVPLATGRVHKPEMFFSGRYYRVIHLLDSDDYDPQSTVADLRSRMMELEARGTGLLDEEFLEQEDGDTAYVLTPLYDSELAELMKLN